MIADLSPVAVTYSSNTCFKQGVPSDNQKTIFVENINTEVTT